jgi:hypothetical protein
MDFKSLCFDRLADARILKVEEYWIGVVDYVTAERCHSNDLSNALLEELEKCR